MYQPKTGARCACKRGVQRDNCSTCEGTGMVVDFAAIRARNRRFQHCTHPEQPWCDCDWCRVVRAQEGSP